MGEKEFMVILNDKNLVNQVEKFIKKIPFFNVTTQIQPLNNKWLKIKIHLK